MLNTVKKNELKNKHYKTVFNTETHVFVVAPRDGGFSDVYRKKDLRGNTQRWNNSESPQANITSRLDGNIEK